MTKSYIYDSNVLAEERGTSGCPEVQVYLDITIDDDQHVDWTVNALYADGEPMPQLTGDALEELTVQVLMCIEADTDIFSDWAAYKQGEADYARESQEDR